MDIINCHTCRAELRLEETDVVELQPEGAHCEESRYCCPYCHTVLLLAVTIAEDDLFARTAEVASNS